MGCSGHDIHGPACMCGAAVHACAARPYLDRHQRTLEHPEHEPRGTSPVETALGRSCVAYVHRRIMQKTTGGLRETHSISRKWHERRRSACKGEEDQPRPLGAPDLRWAQVGTGGAGSVLLLCTTGSCTRCPSLSGSISVAAQMTCEATEPRIWVEAYPQPKAANI